MNFQRARFGHRRANIQAEESPSPLTNRTNVDFRSSALNQYHITVDRDSIPTNFGERRSFDIEAKPIVIRRPEIQSKTKINSFDNIRNTLTQLKKKIQSAKSTLKTHKILNKNVILEESEDEQIHSKNFELLSFHQSSGSHMLSNSNSLDESKKQFLEQLRKYETTDLSRLKGYYMCQVAKALKYGSKDIINHIAFNWKVLRSCGGLPQPSIQQIMSKKPIQKWQNGTRRILVLGLDGTLIHVEAQRQSEQDLDVVFKLDNNQQKKAYVRLRPYAMTFLKKMSKFYDIVIFSDRAQSQTEAILEAIDPFKQRFKMVLSVDHCIKIKNVWTKDLRILGKDLSQMLIVDHQPYSYLFQIDNAVPILPFNRGNDDQLYGLQKYLLQAIRSSDLRKFNRFSFQLNRYSEFASAFDVVQDLYLNRR